MELLNLGGVYQIIELWSSLNEWREQEGPYVWLA